MKLLAQFKMISLTQKKVLGCAILMLCLLVTLYSSDLPFRAKTKSNIYFTWKSPEFGRYGNQLVLFLTACKFAELTGAQFIPPAFVIEDREVEFSEIFESHSNRYLPEIDSCWISLRDEVLNNSKKLEIDQFWALAEKGSEETMVYQISEDALWDWGTCEWNMDLLFYGAPDWKRIANVLKLNAKFEGIVQSVLGYDPRMRKAIGIHIRGEDFKKECVQPIKFINPAFWFYVCYLSELEMLSSTISEWEISNTQPILISSNFGEEYMTNFERLYSGRVIVVDDEIYTRAVNISETDLKMYRAVLDQQLLIRTQTFIGSRISSYSQIIDIFRGNGENDYFPRRFLGIRLTTLLSITWYILMFYLTLRAINSVRYDPGLKILKIVHTYLSITFLVPYLITKPVWLYKKLYYFGQIGAYGHLSLGLLIILGPLVYILISYFLSKDKVIGKTHLV